MSANNGPKLPSYFSYVFNGIYQWLSDNQQTHYITVDLRDPGVRGLEQFQARKLDTLTLNISLTAAPNLHVGTDALTFSCRFNGKNADVFIPFTALLALYGRESGEGMPFRVAEPQATRVMPVLSEAATSNQPQSDDVKPQPTAPEPPRPTGKPSLRVVK